MVQLGAVVVGLGGIGLMSDLLAGPCSHVFSHARAFDLHPSFALLGGMDPDAEKRRLMEQTYGCAVSSSLENLLVETRPDIVALAVPSNMHCTVLQQVLSYTRPRAILCEKPLSHDINEARAIVAACRDAGCDLYVNYIRRADAGVQEVRRRLIDGEIATPLKGVVWYSKGLLHNGSHFFDLLQYWLGAYQGARVIDRGREWLGDVEPDLLLNFALGRVCFLAAREEDYSYYTVELVSPSGRLRYDLGGWRILWQPTVRSKANPGYIVLDRVEHEIPNQLASIQWHVVDQLARALTGGAHCLCTGQEALSALEHLSIIKDSL